MVLADAIKTREGHLHTTKKNKRRRMKKYPLNLILMVAICVTTSAHAQTDNTTPAVFNINGNWQGVYANSTSSDATRCPASDALGINSTIVISTDSVRDKKILSYVLIHPRSGRIYNRRYEANESANNSYQFSESRQDFEEGSITENINLNFSSTDTASGVGNWTYSTTSTGTPFSCSGRYTVQSYSRINVFNIDGNWQGVYTDGTSDDETNCPASDALGTNSSIVISTSSSKKILSYTLTTPRTNNTYSYRLEADIGNNNFYQFQEMLQNYEGGSLTVNINLIFNSADGGLGAGNWAYSSDTTPFSCSGTYKVESYTRRQTVFTGTNWSEFEGGATAVCNDPDIDNDDDGLIELCYLGDLDAVRHVLDGTSYQAPGSATTTTNGCGSGGCRGYELVRDLDFQADDSYRTTENKARWTTTSEGGWSPIGSLSDRFSGIFDGNGYTLSNLLINKPSDNNIGLFGVLSSSGTITGISLSDVVVRGNTSVGSLVGGNWGTISNSYSIGSVSGTGDGVGGLVGENIGGTITNSYGNGRVTGRSNVGGLVGHNNRSGTISNSYSSRSVNGGGGIGGLVGWNNGGTISNSYSNGSISGNSLVGGLVGANTGTISNSYSIGSVSGMGDRVGGLVGWNGGTISNSYSSGSVSGSNEVGGLVGTVVAGTVSNSYSSGSVRGRFNNIGGLVGANSGGTISNSYWDIVASRLLISAGGTSRTTAQLQAPTTASSIYTQWSEDDWDFGTSAEYPTIKYTAGTDADNSVCGTAGQPLCGSLLAGQGRILIAISTPTLVRRTAAMEGDIIVLKTEQGHSIVGVTQTGGAPLTVATINPAEHRILLPANLVGREAVRTTLTFQVAIHDGANTHQATVSIVVLKINNGHGVSISQDGNDLTVPMASSLPDPDGAVNVSSVSYQWQKCLVGEDCSSETGWSDTSVTARLYSVVETERRRNNRFRAIVRYRDGQSYDEEVIESITYSVSSVSSASTFTGTDWSEFEGGAAAVCDDADVDNDNDGLIEICHLEDLDAIRHAPDGFGYQPYSDAAKSTKGCGVGGCNGYELVRDLDFEAVDSYLSTANQVRWTTGSGWIPILGFSGTFDGNGYTLSGLMIDRTSSGIGLFSSLSSRGVIDEIGLLNVAVTGRGGVVGSLVGGNWGTISNSYSSGSVSSNAPNVGGLVGWSNGTVSNSYSSGSVSGNSDMGGLVGTNGGTIRNSYSSGSVSGGNDIGGLVGINESGVISNSYSSSLVSGNLEVGGLVGANTGTINNSYSSGPVSGTGNRVGSLVGANTGTISNSYSIGSVRGMGNRVGGLVGWNKNGTISNSYSNGSVSGSNEVGGLVGENTGTISNSYSSGSVSGFHNTGGLVGTNSGETINNSYSSGSVTGVWGVGGLVGLNNNGAISNSYSSGSTSGDDNVGGLVGLNRLGHISNSYSSGSVRGRFSNVGGLVGENHGGRISNSYWDIVASRLLISAVGVGKTTAQLQAPTTASGIYSKWSEDDWYFGTSTEYPTIKYTAGTDADNPICSTVGQPLCGSLLAGQGRILIAISTPTPVRRTAAMEGDIIVLKTEQANSIVGVTQTDGASLTVETINPAEHRISLPADLVGRESLRTTLTFQVAIHDGVDTHQTTVSIRVLKINNGHGVSISQDGNDLTASMASSLPDPDGAVNVSSVSYQWQKCLVGEDCSSETGWSDTSVTARLYSVVETERRRNNRFRAIVRYRDGQSYDEEVIESITYSVSSVSSASTFTGTDWSEFEGGAAAVCDDADVDNDNDGLIEICHLEDLDAVRHAPDGSGYQPYSDAAKSAKGCGSGSCSGYELVRDLDFEAADSYLSSANQVRWTTGSGWIPILGFSGTFYGNGYTLSGLMIDRPSNNIGLFGSLSRGIIDEIGLLNVAVTGGAHVGGLVGWSNGTISNSYSSGSVNGDRNVGSLVGSNNEGTISNSYSSGSVSGTDRRVGGLVGQNRTGGTISNSYSSGSVSGTGSRVGGLVGANGGTISNSYSSGSVSSNAPNVGGLVGRNGGTISNSYSSGSVSGSDNAGGLVGENSGTISNSYSRGSVAGVNHMGGLVGLNHSGNISNSYSTGSVSGSSEVGGLVGENSGTIGNSYWNTETSGLLRSAGGTSKTTVELQAPTSATGIYSTWSSVVWDFGTFIQYPAIKYTTGTDVNNPACGTLRQPPCGSLLPGQRVRHIAISTETDVRAEAVEGEVIVLDATRAGGASYRWKYIGDASLILPATNTAIFRFSVPLNVAVGNATTEVLVFQLTVSGDMNSATTVSIVVHDDSDDGPIAQPTITRITARKIMVSADLASDPDGAGTIQAYLWQKCLADDCSNEGQWEDVSGAVATSSSYQIPDAEAVANNRLRAQLTYRDGQNYQRTRPSVTFIYANQRPTLSGSIEDQFVTIGTTLNKQILMGVFEDADGDPLSYTATGLPADSNLVLSEDGSLMTRGSTRVVGTATTNTAFAITVEVTADDEDSTVATTFKLFFNAETSGTVTITADNALNQLEAIDDATDANGIASKTYQWSKHNGSAFVAIDGETRSIYALPPNKEARAAGTRYQVIAVVTDRIGQTTALSAVHTIANRIPMIADIDPIATTEGEVVTIVAEVGDANFDSLSYLWRATTGDKTSSILADSTVTSATLAFTVPKDWASTAQTTLSLSISVGDGMTTSTKPVTVSITRTDNGGLTTTPTIIETNRRLTISAAVETDPDGAGTIRAYLWQICRADDDCNQEDQWRGVLGIATSSSYQIQEDEAIKNNQFRVQISYRDGQNYQSTVTAMPWVHPNQRPTLSGSIDDQFVTIGTTLNKQVLMGVFEDADRDSLRYRATGLPRSSNLVLSEDGRLMTRGSTRVVGTATTNTAFAITVEVTAADEDSTVATTFKLFFNAETSGTVTITADNALNQLEAIDDATDANGIASKTYQWSKHNGSAFVAIDGETRSIYALPPNKEARAAGTRYQVVVVVTDRIGQTTALPAVHTIANRAPVIADIDPIATTEGEVVTIVAEVNDANFDSLSYFWRATAGDKTSSVLARSTVASATLVFTVPEDWASTAQTTLSLSISVSDGATTSTKPVTVNITRTDNGGLTTTPTVMKANRRLTVQIDLSSDPDGTGSVSMYQWQRCSSGCNTEANWTDLAGATSKSYQITEPDAADGKQFRVLLTYSDRQGYSRMIVSEVLSYQKPTLAGSIEDQFVTIGTTLNKQILTGVFESADEDTLRYTATGLPRNSNLMLSAEGSLMTSSISRVVGTATTNTASAITVEVTADDSIGIATTTFKLFFNAETSGTVTITADNALDQLEATDDVTDANGIASKTYQWSKHDGSAFVAVDGETRSTYALPPDKEVRAAGTRYQVVVVVTDRIGQTTTLSAVHTIANRAPMIADIGPIATTEGEVVIIVAEASDANFDDLSYLWRVTTGDKVSSILARSIVTSATLVFVVPEDWASTTQTTLGLSISVGDGETTSTKPVTVSITRTVNVVSIAAAFTGDWSEFSYTANGETFVGAKYVCEDTDIDNDDDGLIELCYLGDLDTVRYVLDGSGYKSSASATASTQGCASGGCKGYELVRDLDFNDDDSYRTTANKMQWATTSTGGWSPIGDNDNGFSGIFDGNGRTLSNLTIHTTANHVGLFGRLSSSGTITRISLSDVVAHGSNWVGGLIGYNDEGTISNSYSSGRISGDDSDVGGLVGWNSGGSISNSYSSGSISGDSLVGGLVGANGEGGTISNSYSSGSASGDSLVGGLVGVNEDATINNSYSTGQVSGSRDVGGLVGKNNRGTVSNSYSSGLVWGGYREAGGFSIVGERVGGLVGENDGKIFNSYSRGEAVFGSSEVGGLVGANDDDGTISNSYSTGQVSGSRDVGGLVGRNSGTVNDSYWDITTSRLLTSAGGTSKTTIELQTPVSSTGIYSTWSEDDWHFGTSAEYPAIKYTTGTDVNNLACGIPQQPLCGRLLPDQGRMLVVISTETSVRAQADEGDAVVLDATRDGNVTYQWSQTSGTGLRLDTTNAAKLRFVVPTDLVDRDAKAQTLTLQLKVSGDINSATTISIVIRKIDNGPIADLPTITRIDRRLKLSLNLASDPDGAGAVQTYQWQICRGSSATVDCYDDSNWNLAPEAQSTASYTIQAGDAIEGNQFRVQLTYRDGQGYVRMGTLVYNYQAAIRVRLKLFLEGALQ